MLARRGIRGTAGATLAICTLVIALTGCTGTSAPELAVTTAPAVGTPSATPTPTVEAERGTRQNPLAVGESRKISEESMWTVGASAPTEIHDGYVVLPLTLGLDWAAGVAQAEALGQPWSPEDEGVDAYGSLRVEFVSAGGRSFTTMDNYEVTIPNSFYQVGTVYPPADQITANHAISVPADEIEGGLWVLRNGAGDSVFITLD
jgi:hypothetical protein